MRDERSAKSSRFSGRCNRLLGPPVRSAFGRPIDASVVPGRGTNCLPTDRLVAAGGVKGMLGIVGCSAASACVGHSPSTHGAGCPAASSKSLEGSAASTCSPASPLQPHRSAVVTACSVGRTRDWPNAPPRSRSQHRIESRAPSRRRTFDSSAQVCGGSANRAAKTEGGAALPGVVMEREALVRMAARPSEETALTLVTQPRGIGP